MGKVKATRFCMFAPTDAPVEQKDASTDCVFGPLDRVFAAPTQLSSSESDLATKEPGDIIGLRI